jgi:Fe-S-cluster containining protein
VLLQTDAERRRFAPWAITLPVRDHAGIVHHEQVIPYRNERCPFLGQDNRCTIYDDRPQSCRDFECTRHFNQHAIGEHGLFLRGNPHVVAILSVQAPN